MARYVYNLNRLEIPPLETIPTETRKIAMREAVKVVARAVREEAPDSGIRHKNKLRGSFRYLVRREGEEGLVYSRAPHAHLVAYGARPHLIRAGARFGGKGRFLVFRSRGRIVMAHAVRHPGVRANPFHERARDKSAEEVAMILREAAGQAIDGVV